MDDYIQPIVPQRNPNNDYGVGVLSNTQHVKPPTDYAEINANENINSIYPSEHIPDWYKSYQFDWALSKWDSFPTLRDQTIWSDERDGGWYGTVLFTVANCVPQALATLTQIQQYLRTGNKSTYSLDWIYGNRLSTHDQGEGMYFSEALDLFVSDGTPYYADLPGQHYYNEPTPTDGKTAKNIVANVKSSLINRARPYRIESYECLEAYASVEYIKSYIMNYGGVIVDTGTNASWDDITDGLIRNELAYNYSFVDPNSASGGYDKNYHGLVILGWKQINGKLHWVCWSNWGFWGDIREISSYVYNAGLCYLPFDYPLIRNFYTMKPLPRSKPTMWEWTTNIVKGGNVYQTVHIYSKYYTAYILPAVEWNNFTKKINEFLTYKGFPPYNFTQVVRDTEFTISIVNEAIININRMLTTGFLSSSGDITAQLFIDMRNRLNSIT